MIKDSGARREFDTGAVRDVSDDKGRCDLLPLMIVADLMEDDILAHVAEYMESGNSLAILRALKAFCVNAFGGCMTNMLLEVSIHYSEGSKKYAERNWEKGIPLHCYVDSGVRHYLKWKRGDEDERHDRAFVWNMLGLLWTDENIPDMNDLPWSKDKGGS